MLPTHLPSEWGRRQLSLANKIAALSSKIVRNTLSNSSQNNEDDDGLLISTKNFGYVRFGEDDDCVARGDIKAIGKFVIGRFIVRKFETSLPFPLLNAVLYGNEGVQRKKCRGSEQENPIWGTVSFVIGWRSLGSGTCHIYIYLTPSFVSLHHHLINLQSSFHNVSL